MPSLMRPPLLSYPLASIATRTSLSQAEHLAVRKIVGARSGKIVEGALGNADDVMLDELRAFARAVFRVLERAFPLQHRPAVEIMGCKLGEDGAEIDLSVAQRAEPPCPVHPALEATINALPARGIEFRILDVEGFYTLVIDRYNRDSRAVAAGSATDRRAGSPARGSLPVRETSHSSRRHAGLRRDGSRSRRRRRSRRHSRAAGSNVLPARRTLLPRGRPDAAATDRHRAMPGRQRTWHAPSGQDISML